MTKAADEAEGCSMASNNGSSICRLLQDTMRQHDIPGIAVAIFDSDRIVQQHALGKRRLGAPSDVTLNDKFHIGSNTKAMTATTIAFLVERGSFSWDARAIDVLPELSNDIHELHKTITLKQLLTHTAGIQPFTDGREFNDVPELSGTPAQQRYQLTRHLLTKEPFSSPGRASEYSNAGYCIAAAMAERIAGESWEELMRTLLFERLSLDAGFGWPALADEDQPWGHVYEGEMDKPYSEWKTSGTLVAHPPTDAYRVRCAIAPAGDVHLSIIDFARFVQMHLKGCRGMDTLLKPDTVGFMHEDIRGYALGWCVTKKGDAKVSSHNGSAGTFHSVAVLFPLRNFGIVVACNAGHLNAGRGFDELAQTLFNRFKDALPR